MGVTKTTFQPIKLTMSDSERAYVAGIIDGEGYVGILKARKDVHMRPRVDVENTSELLIDYLAKTTGLAKKYKKMRKNSKPNHHQIWSWTVRKFSEIKSLCEAVLPFLVIKRRHTELLLELISLREKSYEKSMEKLVRDDVGKFIGKPSVEYSQREIQIYQELRALNNHHKITE